MPAPHKGPGVSRALLKTHGAGQRQAQGHPAIPLPGLSSLALHVHRRGDKGPAKEQTHQACR